MKKVLALVCVAAVVGLVIARMRRVDAPAAVAFRPESAPGEARTPHASAPAAAPAPLPAAHAAARPSVAAPAPAAQHRQAPQLQALTRTGAAAVAPPAGTLPGQQAVAIQKAVELERAGALLDARKVISDLYPNSEGQVRQAAVAVLDRLNKKLVFDPECTDGATVHQVQAGETLTHVARKYKVSWRCIARINGIDRPETVRVNQKLKILTGPRSILIDKSEFLLALFVDGQFIKQYRIGHGKDNKTPTGDFVIDEMLVNPTWYPPEGGVIKHGEKGHQIGDRWLGFKDKPGATGLGIHGTNEPQTIGAMFSNGCVRMINSDVIELFDLVGDGTTVKIVD